MTIEVNVVLPELVYDQFQQLARQRRQGIGEAIADYLTQHPPNDFPVAQLTSQTESMVDAAIVQEKQAYLRLHKQLWETYPEQYVAIYHGKLVDHDLDKVSLYTRIQQQYPHQFVLIRRVERIAERTLYFRSPRFIER